jgi:hypothetical protein
MSARIVLDSIWDQPKCHGCGKLITGAQMTVYGVGSVDYLRYYHLECDPWTEWSTGDLGTGLPSIDESFERLRKRMEDKQ